MVFRKGIELEVNIFDVIWFMGTQTSIGKVLKGTTFGKVRNLLWKPSLGSRSDTRDCLYDGIERHYEAVIIQGNKVWGAGDATLSFSNTVLNFSAIIARLDFDYVVKILLIICQLCQFMDTTLSNINDYYVIRLLCHENIIK